MRLPITGETCPHYLFFTEKEMVQHGPFAMIKPLLRTEADQTALWNGLLDGSLMAITTDDHSPFTLAEKERGITDIWQGAIGAPGVEALVPDMMTEALTGRITLTQAIQLLSSQPTFSDSQTKALSKLDMMLTWFFMIQSQPSR